jgi:cation transport regulator ChaC
MAEGQTQVMIEPVHPLWYFAYGSNMHDAIFLERRQMHPLATRWGWLDHYRLCFNLPVGPGERGAANLEAEAEARTCGMLYLLTPEECDRLDRTEGLQSNVYRRIPVEVLAEGKERIAAFTYQSSRTRSDRKPSARYLNLLLTGARRHQLPVEYVCFLESFELAGDEREPDPIIRRPLPSA